MFELKKLNFKSINLQQPIEEAADLILTDRKHLDSNPRKVTKDDLLFLLEEISRNDQNSQITV